MPISDKYFDEPTNVWKQRDHPDVPHGTQAPNPPTGLTATGHTTTTISMSWTPATSSGISEVRVYRAASATGTFARVATITGNTTTTFTDTGLASGTQFFYKLTSYNATLNLNSAFSNTINDTTTGVNPTFSPNPVTSLNAVKASGAPTTNITVTWVASAVDGTHNAATGYKVYGDGTLLTTNPITATNYTIVWPTPGDVVTVAVAATNATGDSTLSTFGNVDLDDPPPPTGEYRVLMGASRSNNYNWNFPPEHGGIPGQFEAVRVYDDSVNAWVDVINTFAGAEMLAVTPSNLQTTNVETQWRNLFEDWYYNTDGTARTGRRSPTSGVALHVAIGNEVGGKVTSANFAGWQTAYSSLRRAADTQNGNGSRRFPLVELWVDPTHDQERSGTAITPSVQALLEAIADVLDGVAWSMYPPGRQNTEVDPTYNLPVPADPTVASTATQRDGLSGWLERCFYRTQQTAISVSTTKKLRIAIWEIGNGAGTSISPPNDPDNRPWYVANVLAQWCYERAKFYNRVERMDNMLYWDQEKNQAVRPENIFSHENQTVLTLNGTKPHTSYAWVHWKELNPHYGGTRPASWPTSSASLTAKGWKGITGGTYGGFY